jgi:hypothetical protein
MFACGKPSAAEIEWPDKLFPAVLTAASPERVHCFSGSTTVKSGSIIASNKCGSSGGFNTG